MKNPQNILLAGMIVINVIAGFGAAVPLSVSFQRLTGQQNKSKRYFTLIIGIYFLECIAFAMGMCTQVFSFALAVIWGILLGIWWRDIAEFSKAVETAFWLSLYTCAPTISFSLSLVISWIFAEKGLLDAEGAKNFGIPQFVPFPFNTILGFCSGLALGTLLIKIIITTGIVKFIVSRPPNFLKYLKKDVNTNDNIE